MAPFAGFKDNPFNQGIAIPESFFTAVLPAIESLDELKLCLLFFRMIKEQEALDPYLTEDLILDMASTQELGMTAERVRQALQLACDQKIFVAARYADETIYFLNTPRGRAIQKAIARGLWIPGRTAANTPLGQRPNLFTLYEQNIGPLTPILSQVLEEAERTYPEEWLQEAISLAVKKNVRNWTYVEAILRSWKEKGRNEKDRRDNQENPRHYIEGDLADFIKH